jgi:putative ABC transport system permease protein
VYWSDLIRLSFQTLNAHKMRSSLTVLGLIIGIASVIVLTSIGSGIHQFVLTEFTQFGSHLISVTPGKTTTFGLSGATISTVRPLTLDDAQSLGQLRHIIAAMPMVQGNAGIQSERKERRANVFGVSADLPVIWKVNTTSGRFLSGQAGDSSRNQAVLGSTLRKELFETENPLGKRIRIGSDRFRVIGVLAPKGQMLGFDLDDTIFIPAGKALEMFNRQGLMEINLLYDSQSSVEEMEAAIKALMIQRHGFEDFTIVTQDRMLKTLNSVLSILTLGIGALGGISLLVGSVGILTMMTIAVTERIPEIGLLRAIGAERRDIFKLFLTEALALSLTGGIAGIAFGLALVQSIKLLFPALPIELAGSYVALALGVSLMIGIITGVIPALKAAGLNPLNALRAE